ncbi:MAG: hypothetical protein ACRCYO_18975, partial [Bacteroidia bacterium]
MKKLIRDIRAFAREEVNPIHFACCIVLLTASLFWVYGSGQKFHFTGAASAEGFPFLRNLLVYGLAFLLPLLLYFITRQHREALRQPALWGMAIFAVLIFSYKVYCNTHKIWIREHIDGSEAIFWQRVVGNIGSFILLVVPVFLYWFMNDKKQQAFYGLSVKQFDVKPYLLILAIMLPLVILAATQADFLKQYPKVNSVLRLAKIEEQRFGFGA